MVYRHSVFYSPLIAAIAGGFLKKEGLEAEYRQKPKDFNIYDAFRRGEVDIMQAAVSTSWDPLSRGMRDIPVHFAHINQRDGFFITARQGSPPFQWSVLEGAELVADYAQQPLAMLKYGLHLKGLNWDRIRVINAGEPDSMYSAFRNGQGDYLHLQGPGPQQLEKDGLGRVVAAMGEVIPPVAFSSLMAVRDFLETDAAKAFMKAYRHSLKYVTTATAAELADAESSFFPGIARPVAGPRRRLLN